MYKELDWKRKVCKNTTCVRLMLMYEGIFQILSSTPAAFITYLGYLFYIIRVIKLFEQT